MRLIHAVLLMVLLLFATCVVAQSNFVSESVYRAITQADKLIAENNENGALENLQKLLKRRTLSDYERSVIHRMLGVVYANAADYTAAASHFEQVLQSAKLPADLLRQIRYNLAHIYTQQENYVGVLRLLSPLIQRQQEPTPQESFLLAFTYLRSEQPEQSLLWIERTLALSIQEKVPEYYLSLAINVNLTLEHYPRAVELLNIIVRQYPDNAGYWRQLAAVQSELDNEAQALATMELGYLQGMLTTEHDLKRLATLYLQQGMPYKSVQFLQQLLVDGNDEDYKLHELLASALRQAREHVEAIPHLVKAAQLSGDGKLSLYLAHLYAEQEDWVAADQAVLEAMAKGNLESLAAVRLLRGIIQVQLGDTDLAEQNFIYCLGFDKTREQALQWLQSLGNL